MDQNRNLNRGYRKLENGLLRLTASLQHKRDTGEWSDNLILHESNAAYGGPDND